MKLYSHKNISLITLNTYNNNQLLNTFNIYRKSEYINNNNYYENSQYKYFELSSLFIVFNCNILKQNDSTFNINISLNNDNIINKPSLSIRDNIIYRYSHILYWRSIIEIYNRNSDKITINELSNILKIPNNISTEIIHKMCKGNMLYSERKSGTFIVRNEENELKKYLSELLLLQYEMKLCKK